MRDEIATYPPHATGFTAIGTDSAVRWGTKATLRGGAGTPREKADLLAKLYQDAGFAARVVHGSADDTRIDTRACSSPWRPVRPVSPSGWTTSTLSG